LCEAARIADKTTVFRKAYDALTEAAAPFLKGLPSDSPLLDLLKQRDDAANSCLNLLDKWTLLIAKKWSKPCEAKLAAQRKLLDELDALATACRDLIKDVDLVYKLTTRLVEAAEKDENARDNELWNGRGIGRGLNNSTHAREDLR
jgi:type I restriction enzyme M protein